MDEIRMSVPYFQVPNWIFDAETGLKAQDMLVFIYLCRCGNNGSAAFPSYQTIADKCGLSRRAAIRAVKVLIEKGFVVKCMRVEETEKGTLNKTNVYEVQLQGVVSDSHYGSDSQSPYKELLINNNAELLARTTIDYYLAKLQETGRFKELRPVSAERWQVYREKLKAAITFKELKESDLLNAVDRFFAGQNSVRFMELLWSLGVKKHVYKAGKFGKKVKADG